MKIEIVSIPPGFAPLCIREKWVGVTIPLVSEEEAEQVRKCDDSNALTADGYIVRGVDAVHELINAQRAWEAVNFWSNPMPPCYLHFSKECCKLVP